MFECDPNTFFQLQTLRFETNRKGTLNQMTSYWDAATVFEIAVLDKDFKRATDAALKMFKLLRNKSTDHIHSTMQNIWLLVDEKSGWHKVQSRVPDSPGSRRAGSLFEFWIDYFQVWALTHFLLSVCVWRANQ